MKKFLFVAFVSFSLSNLYSQCFSTKIDFDAGSEPREIVVDDFNNDMKPDMIVGNGNSPFVTISLGNGDGTFVSSTYASTYPGSSHRPDRIASGDFNGDGKKDFVANWLTSSHLAIALGNGDGTFTAGVNLTASDNPYRVTTGDLNEDGLTDIVVIMQQAYTMPNISVFIATSGGNFNAPINLLTDNSSPQGVTLTDMNNDNHLDIVAESPNFLTVYLGDGAGGFTMGPGFAGMTGAPGNIDHGDFNEDGNEDIFASANGMEVYWFFGDGTGGFISSTSMYYGYDTNRWASVADYNGDSNLDVALAISSAFYSFQGVQILYGTGTGNFPTSTSFTTYNLPNFILDADMNTDGLSDILVTNTLLSANNSALYLNGTVPPVVVANCNDTAVCPGEMIKLIGSGTALSYAWTGGVTNNVLFAAPSATTTYTVTGTKNGCSSTNTITIIPNQYPPTIVANVNDTTVCPGQSIILSGSGANTYSWSSQTNGVPFAAPSAITTYTVTGTTTQGCFATNSITIFPNQYPPTVVANVNDTSICPGQSIILFGSGANTYTWSANTDGVPFSAPANTTTYSVTGTTTDGCFAYDTLTIHPNQYPPTVVANVNDTSICPTQSIILFGTGADTYSWSANTDGVPFSAPSGVTTYTVTGTTTDGCFNTDSITIYPNQYPPAVVANVNDTSICPTQSIVLFGTGADTYSWSANTDSVSFSAPIGVTTYTVTGTTIDGCFATDSITIYPNQYPPTVTANVNDTAVCPGESIILFGGGADTYVWSANTDSVPFSAPANMTTYVVTGTTTDGCFSTDTITIYPNEFPPIIVANAVDDTICWGGGPLTLFGTGGTSYTWSSGTDGIPFTGPDSTTNYSVTGYLNGCFASDNITIYVEPEPIQDLCVVTTDSATGNFNIIIWEKEYLQEIDSIIIYREITLNNYQRIGAVHYDSLSLFTDPTANPNSTSYKYKVTGKNSCGIEAPLSNYHNTIHLQYFGLGNFQWSLYEIEGMTNQVASYNFYRDDMGDGNFQLLAVIPGGNDSYTDVNHASFPAALYRVDVIWIDSHTCTPTRAEGETSRSNIKGLAPNGIENNNLEQLVLVFPNPSNGIFNVQIPQELVGEKMMITDALGKVVFVSVIQNMNDQIDLTTLESGMYFLHFTAAGDQITKKLFKK